MTRKNTLTRVLLAATIIVVSAGAWFFFFNGKAQPDQSTTANPGEDVTALVKTQLIQKQPLADTLTAFGDVTTGKVVGISFPRAGQVSQLLVIVGQRVKTGTPLAALTSDPVAQTSYIQASNAVKFAQADLERTQQLFTLQLATQAQVDTARKTLQDAEANLTAQKKLGGDLGVATVTAPFDGVVTALAVAQGDRIQPGATILQLGHMDALRVQLGIEPSQSRLVRTGMPVTLSPVQSQDQTINAKINEVQDMVDAKTQLINAVTILPTNAANFLVPGTHAQGIIQVGQHEAFVAPRQAVLVDDNGAYIFQVVQGKAHRVNVTKGTENQNLVGIEGRFDPKNPVVVLGNYELQEGMKVREAAQ
jgi:membrane fusion protein (multidrug efflux system)